MNVKSNKNGTVSILQMPKAMYSAIQNIIMSSEQTFEWQEEEQEWWSNSDFLCVLSPEEKEAMDKKNWFI